MPSAPSIDSSTASTGVRLAVFLGPEDGGPVAFDSETGELTDGERADWLHVTTIERSAGTQGLDQATLTYDLAARGERIVDLQTPEEWARQIEIRIEEDGVEPDAWTPLFWGDLTGQRVLVDRQTESAVVHARICPHHFGDVLDGYRVYDNTLGDQVLVHRDPVFNPLIKGKVIPNRSVHRDAIDDYFLWLEPEAVRSPSARTVAGETPALWTIPDVIDTLCRLLNPDEEFIRNPRVWHEDDDGNAVYDAIYDDAPAIRNIRLQRGRYLCEYLDAVLPPHGYNWFVSQTWELQDEADEASPLVSARRITIYRIGRGPEKELWYQAPGEDLDPERQTLERIDVTTDIASLANVVVCEGALKEYEITIELFPAWPDADDLIDVGDLHTDLKEYPDSQYLTKRNVHRLWVGNESGEYNGLRTIYHPIDAAPNLTSVIGPYVRRRRKLGPLLVLQQGVTGDEGRRYGPRLEWLNPESNDWEPAPWPYKLLDDQIGIYFTGEFAPAELAEGMQQQNEIRLRISGTITGDDRLTATADVTGGSPNARTVKLWLDVADRFHFRTFDDDQAGWDGHWSTGSQTVFKTQMGLGARDNADDSTAIAAYAQRLRTIEESALIRATFALFGLHQDYEIGDLATRINGRNISLDRNSLAADSAKYLQVVGLQLDYQQQRTTVSVERAEAIPKARTFA